MRKYIDEEDAAKLESTEWSSVFQLVRNLMMDLSLL